MGRLFFFLSSFVPLRFDDFSAALEFLFLLCVYIYDNRLLVCCDHETLIQQSTLTCMIVLSCWSLLSSAFQISCLCTLLLSWLLLLLSCLCVWMVSFFYCIFAFTCEPPYFILCLFLVVAFSFQCREVPLKIELVGGSLNMFVKGTYNVIKRRIF